MSALAWALRWAWRRARGWFWLRREWRLPARWETCPRCEGYMFVLLDGSPATELNANAMGCMHCQATGGRLVPIDDADDR